MTAQNFIRRSVPSIVSLIGLLALPGCFSGHHHDDDRQWDRQEERREEHREDRRAEHRDERRDADRHEDRHYDR